MMLGSDSNVAALLCLGFTIIIGEQTMISDFTGKNMQKKRPISEMTQKSVGVIRFIGKRSTFVNFAPTAPALHALFSTTLAEFLHHRHGLLRNPVEPLGIGSELVSI